MAEISTTLIFLSGLAIGVCLTAFVARFLLRGERRATADKLEMLQQTEERFRETFQALSAQALNQNNESFLQLAETKLKEFQQSAGHDLEKRQRAIDDLIKPVRESLQKVDSKLEKVEKERHGHYEALTTQLSEVAVAHQRLRSETTNLVSALRRPNTRGRWGEIQLKRVVEMAGMLEYCDFSQQDRASSDGRSLQPDLVVHLAGGKNVVVDAKAPLDGYLDALQAEDEGKREAKLKEFALHVRSHMKNLGSKNYWAGFQPAPELVVMFLPGEAFYGSALEYEPGLIEYGVDQKVILASPSTLIALLQAVVYGWREEKMAQNAEQISKLGRTLYDRLATLAGHFDGIRRGLDRTVESYNKAVGSLEGRVLAPARRFKEMGAGGSNELPEPEIVERTTRRLQTPEAENREDPERRP